MQEAPVLCDPAARVTGRAALTAAALPEVVIGCTLVTAVSDDHQEPCWQSQSCWHRLRLSDTSNCPRFSGDGIRYRAQPSQGTKASSYQLLALPLPLQPLQESHKAEMTPKSPPLPVASASHSPCFPPATQRWCPALPPLHTKSPKTTPLLGCSIQRCSSCAHTTSPASGQ